MRIRFNTSVSGSRFSYKPGDEAEWTNKEEAARLIASGAATEVKVSRPERAVAPRGDVETTTPPKTAETATSKPAAETAVDSKAASTAPAGDAPKAPAKGGKANGRKTK